MCGEVPVKNCCTSHDFMYFQLFSFMKLFYNICSDGVTFASFVLTNLQIQHHLCYSGKLLETLIIVADASYGYLSLTVLHNLIKSMFVCIVVVYCLLLLYYFTFRLFLTH
jgi:hypothetical protein